MISVIIPLYNKASTISNVINSVLHQTVQDFEIIVVNDGSTDDGVETVRRIKDSRIKVIDQVNQGVSAARNRGVKESKCEWLAFLDADDVWKPTYLETVMELMRKYPDCSVFATAYQRCNANGVLSDVRLNGVLKDEDQILDNYFEIATKSDPPIHTSSVIIRKESLLSVGGFPEGVHQGEDLLTWARLATKYKIAYCLKPQSIFYTGEVSSMENPKRIPDTNDPVGKGLEELYNSNPNISFLKQYLAHWHKMRASIYMRLPKQSRYCRAEIRKALQWHFNRRLILYTLLSLLPYPLRMKILNLH